MDDVDMARQIAGLEEKVEMLTDALRDLSIGLGAKQIVYGFGLQSILRLRGSDPEFGSELKASVLDFFETNNPPLEIETAMLEAMNALLESAGQIPPGPSE